MAKQNVQNVNEQVTSTGETEKDLQGEKIQANTEEVKKDLKVNISFTDKYDETKSYKINDVIKADSISKERYDELVKDERKLVSIMD